MKLLETSLVSEVDRLVDADTRLQAGRLRILLVGDPARAARLGSAIRALSAALTVDVRPGETIRGDTVFHINHAMVMETLNVITETQLELKGARVHSEAGSPESYDIKIFLGIPPKTNLSLVRNYLLMLLLEKVSLGGPSIPQSSSPKATGESEFREAAITQSKKPLQLRTASGEVEDVRAGQRMRIVRRAGRDDIFLAVIMVAKPYAAYVNIRDITHEQYLKSSLAPQAIVAGANQSITDKYQNRSFSLRNGSLVHVIEKRGNKLLILGPERWGMGEVEASALQIQDRS